MDGESNARKLWIIGGTALLSALVAVTWLGRPAYYRHKETRSLKQAREFRAKGDYRSAVLSVRNALTVNPTSLEATRLMAELSDEAGSSLALGWRKRLAELDPTLDHKILAAVCALRFEKPPHPVAAQILEEVRPLAETNVSYHLAASELALKLNRLDDAARHLAAAAGLQPTNRIHQLNLATLRLRSTNSSLVDDARRELAVFITDPDLGPHALRSLTADNLVRQQPAEAVTLSRRLLSLPQATFDDRLQHLTVLRAAGSSELSEWVVRLEIEAATNVVKTTRLVSWLNANDSAREAIHWLATLPQPVRDTPPLPFVEADAYIALRDWEGLENRLNSQRWKDQEFLRLALLSRAWREQRRNEVADALWRRAVEAAGGRNEMILAQMAANWGWQDETENLLWAAVKRSRSDTWALRSLLQRYSARNDTAGVYRVYQALLERQPSSPELQNNLAMLGLLLGRDLPRAVELARQVYEADQTNAIPVSTYAFALHLQGKTAEGIRLLQSLPETQLQRPNIALYYGILLAAAGHRDQAHPFLAVAEKGSMLPEERRLLTQARAGN